MEPSDFPEELRSDAFHYLRSRAVAARLRSYAPSPRPDRRASRLVWASAGNLPQTAEHPPVGKPEGVPTINPGDGLNHGCYTKSAR